MSVKVVDASAIAALLFGEPEAPTIAVQLRNVKLAAPPLLPFEVASVCLKKLHRHPEQREALLAAHQLFGRMAIVETRVDLPEAITLAERRGLQSTMHRTSGSRKNSKPNLSRSTSS